jgi:hypothetical protein
MAGKALLAFLVTATLAVVAFSMHAKHPEQISLTPALMLGAVALISLAVASFGKPGVNARQRDRDRNGLRNVCAGCGHAGGRNNPLTVVDGYRICESHVSDPDSGFHGHGR